VTQLSQQSLKSSGHTQGMNEGISGKLYQCLKSDKEWHKQITQQSILKTQQSNQEK